MGEAVMGVACSLNNHQAEWHCFGGLQRGLPLLPLYNV
jgi:hypothetical protein